MKLNFYIIFVSCFLINEQINTYKIDFENGENFIHLESNDVDQDHVVKEPEVKDVIKRLSGINYKAPSRPVSQSHSLLNRNRGLQYASPYDTQYNNNYADQYGYLYNSPYETDHNRNEYTTFESNNDYRYNSQPAKSIKHANEPNRNLYNKNNNNEKNKKQNIKQVYDESNDEIENGYVKTKSTSKPDTYDDSSVNQKENLYKEILNEILRSIKTYPRNGESYGSNEEQQNDLETQPPRANNRNSNYYGLLNTRENAKLAYQSRLNNDYRSSGYLNPSYTSQNIPSYLNNQYSSYQNTDYDNNYNPSDRSDDSDDEDIPRIFITNVNKNSNDNGDENSEEDEKTVGTGMSGTRSLTGSKLTASTRMAPLKSNTNEASTSTQASNSIRTIIDTTSTRRTENTTTTTSTTTTENTTTTEHSTDYESTDYHSEQDEEPKSESKRNILDKLIKRQPSGRK